MHVAHFHRTERAPAHSWRVHDLFDVFVDTSNRRSPNSQREDSTAIICLRNAFSRTLVNAVLFLNTVTEYAFGSLMLKSEYSILKYSLPTKALPETVSESPELELNIGTKNTTGIGTRLGLEEDGLLSLANRDHHVAHSDRMEHRMIPALPQ
ncbi:hypothetical protein EVAR_43431_1 [Eumeta japonica]|uniref:Uncharacterized protein n=1 Tax=Eumeta variegata TaxID=151549 RepID=A0A4C1WT62_EUMVA|nr:hypothetical protein EVAR_43431_1 [Eumeta japonica]